MKIGLIAGRGDLPGYVIQGAKDQGYDVFVAAIDGFSEPSSFDTQGKKFGIAEFGKITRAFKAEKCDHVCFAGYIDRPNFLSLKPDLKGLKFLPGAIKAAAKGDNALLAYLLSVFEKDGFKIISTQDLCQSLLLETGHLGDVHLTKDHLGDAKKACEIALEMGRLDIGQGAVVCRGLTLAVEAQEGTDAMLSRLCQINPEIRGTQTKREGVLAKMVKPNQERRVDMPAIGVETVSLAAKAGLAGIVAESGGALIIGKAEVIELANATGIFIAGLPAPNS